MEPHDSQHNMPDVPLIGLIWHRNGPQPAEQWHTDHPSRERPPAATILYGVEVPAAGGGTNVALVIDNRATLHRAHGDHDRSQSRVLWRIIVEGDRPRLRA
jgi:alpha-ketoglutarate-dependent taurine dioxygenase